ncbi:polyribonucleotide nucleotidyltransferase [Candidatus Roizmanbacteria bacterium]|nr:polyribonucleotide nucleotidyltransferase [Candidatus Roizmanbacteria bacterium]
MKIFEKSIDLNGQKLTFQFGKLAQAVDASVYASLGDTAVLVTVGIGPENPAIDYFPLSVEYVEKLYAGGLIKGSRWVKREGRPSDEAVLIGRLIDRGIRPLFPKAYKKQVQIVITLLSVDGENDPEVLAPIAVSAALSISSVPWAGPVSTMQVGYIQSEGAEGNLVLNPDETEKQHSKLDLVVTSTKDKVLMIETQAEMLDDAIIQDGLELAKQENTRVIEFIESIQSEIGKTKQEPPQEKTYEDIIELLKSKYADRIGSALRQAAGTAGSNSTELDGIIEGIYTDLEGKYDRKQIAAAIEKFNYANIRKDVLENKKRIDGRALDEVRPLYIEKSLLPRTHGSALFQRGQTQILSIVTLGPTTLEQLIEGPEGKEAKRYIHHYSDGPYSYGTVGRMGVPSRRAIGHGALAEKGIEPVLPTTEEFPYAIRVVSEILGENGSSSMGSICGSSLALMDAGVPLKAAVAGIAMGIVTKSDDEYAIMTDIVGLEDFSGEMDFKIAGTTEGVTAIQLDVKNKGLTAQMIKDIFAQAKKARLHILESMNAVIAKPEKEVSKYAPKVVMLHPPQDKIGEIIGPGGKNIRALIARTQTEINIDDDGTVTISGIDMEGVQAAVAHIESLSRVLQIGETFEGPVKRILPFGAFVELLPGKDGMVHVSKMGPGFIRDPSQVVSIGQIVKVEVIKIDDQGRVDLKLIREPNTSSESQQEYEVPQE